jgi:hypothetical protein
MREVDVELISKGSSSSFTFTSAQQGWGFFSLSFYMLSLLGRCDPGLICKGSSPRSFLYQFFLEYARRRMCNFSLGGAASPSDAIGVLVPSTFTGQDYVHYVFDNYILVNSKNTSK